MKKEKVLELIDALAYQIDKHDLIGIYAYLLQNRYSSRERAEFISLVIKESKKDCQEFINNVSLWDIEDDLVFAPLEYVIIPWHIDINYTPKIALAKDAVFRRGLTINATRLCDKFLYGAAVTGDIHIKEGCKELGATSLRFISTGGCSLYLPSTLTKINITALPVNRNKSSNIKIYFSGTRKQLTTAIRAGQTAPLLSAAYQANCSDGVWDGLDKSTWDA